MNSLTSSAISICSVALVCSIFSTIVPNGGTKKTLSFVIGAFMVCCLILPVKNTITDFKLNSENYFEENSPSATDDEAFSKAIISTTRENLENTLINILEQNNILVDKCDIILAESKNKSIIISEINIYIKSDYVLYSDIIKNLTEKNFSKTPIITVMD